MKQDFLGWRVRTLGTALLLPPLVHLVSVRRLVPPGAPRTRGQRAGPAPERLAEWVDLVLGRLPGLWRHTCLKRSLVLYALLHRSGESVELRIGVRIKGGGDLAAHAWLVKDGAPFLERGEEPTEAFREIARFPELPAKVTG